MSADLEGIVDERIGTAHRLTVLDLLSKALEHGFLDLAEYEQRMTIVNSAKTASVLMEQVSDLPPQFRWDPRQSAIPPVVQATGSNESIAPMTALVLGIISIPASVCLGAGALFGAGAIVLGRIGMRTPQSQRASIGVVLGIIGVALSLGFWVLVGLGSLVDPK
jgi:hypothetical protein